jgi:16S rRNA (uracil1498-N3)-methyltransferase
MHRFYLPPERCAGHALRLEGREARHALRVLRLKRGEPAVVLDGAGNELVCQVADAARDAVTLAVKEKKFTPPPPFQITLLQALPKGKIIENIIQKSVELGAWRIVPLLTERVVARLDDESAEHKRDHWRQVAIEAIKQCGAAWLPQIEAPMTIGQFLARRETFELSLVGSLQADARHPRELFRQFKSPPGCRPKTAGIWIGPEGDFTLEELRAIQAAGALPISLGRRVLRVETVAVYSLALLNYELAAD